MAEAARYRRATREDLTGVAEVFLAAFPESVQHYVGHPIAPTVLADVFAICLDTEPEAFFVAEVSGRIAGYIFAPLAMSRLVQTAVRRGHLWRIAGRWLRGCYGIGWHPVWVAARNWVSLLRDAREETHASDARIFSIAVHPDFQGFGIGTGLMQVGLAYLAAQGARVVRLEVRPQNAAAVHLYEKYGFSVVGRTHDTQGDWLIMLKGELPNPG